MAIISERSRKREEEGESVFISMTDLSVSFLFILLILLAFFATQIKPEETVPRSEYEKALARIAELEKQVVALEQQVDDLVRENRLLRELLSRRDSTIQKLKLKIAGQKQKIELQRADIRKKIERIETLKERIAALEVEVAALTAEVENLKRRELDPLARYLRFANLQRRKFLNDLKVRIEETTDIKVTVFSEEGLIRLAADEFFGSAKWKVDETNNPEAHRIAVAIAHAMAEVVPTYTLGPHSRFDPDRNGAFALIETIQIEGHTDADRIGSHPVLIDNLDLSSRRAAAMFRVIRDTDERLLRFLNLRGAPVMSFSGYGALRPLSLPEGLSVREAKRRNRRIDLRFILQSPQSEAEIGEIRHALQAHGAGVQPDE